jgi:TPR repeat protein
MAKLHRITKQVLLLGTVLFTLFGCSRQKPLSAGSTNAEVLAAAQGGDKVAQLEMGLRYLEGRGLLKDGSEAARWFRNAADQGYAIAQFNLGLCYQKGIGVPVDHEQAVKWFRKAADQQLAQA